MELIQSDINSLNAIFESLFLRSFLNRFDSISLYLSQHISTKILFINHLHYRSMETFLHQRTSPSNFFQSIAINFILSTNPFQLFQYTIPRMFQCSNLFIFRIDQSLSIALPPFLSESSSSHRSISAIDGIIFLLIKINFCPNLFEMFNNRLFYISKKNIQNILDKKMYSAHYYTKSIVLPKLLLSYFEYASCSTYGVATSSPVRSDCAYSLAGECYNLDKCAR